VSADQIKISPLISTDDTDRKKGKSLRNRREKPTPSKHGGKEEDEPKAKSQEPKAALLQ
jgi:hypothetical protein